MTTLAPAGRSRITPAPEPVVLVACPVCNAEGEVLVSGDSRWFGDRYATCTACVGEQVVTAARARMIEARLAARALDPLAGVP